jgi:ribosomal-protein-alanine N-acetyltransferase
MEVGLYWAVAPRHQRRGYAAEAGRALADYALGQLGLWRIVATTDHDNLASQRVMQKLGMALHRNPGGEPPYFQVVGVLPA